MIIDSRIITPTEPTITDALSSQMSDLAGLEEGAVVSEYGDVHGITGQNLPLSVRDFEEHPEW